MKYIMLILFVLLLVGCAISREKQSAESTFAETQMIVDSGESFDKTSDSDAIPVVLAEGFPFEYKGQLIHVGIPAEPIIAQLGDPQNYFEAPSCAFEGIDKTFFYSGIELHTFPLDNKDYVLSVLFTDDSVETPEGVYLGINTEDALALLGDGYEEKSGQYTYTKGRGLLTVITENDVVVDLSYSLIVAE